jgi:hypothetical protein
MSVECKAVKENRFPSLITMWSHNSPARNANWSSPCASIHGNNLGALVLEFHHNNTPKTAEEPCRSENLICRFSATRKPGQD